MYERSLTLIQNSSPCGLRLPSPARASFLWTRSQSETQGAGTTPVLPSHKDFRKGLRFMDYEIWATFVGGGLQDTLPQTSMETIRQLGGQISTQIPKNHIPKTPLYPYAKYQPVNLKPEIPENTFPHKSLLFLSPKKVQIPSP